MQVDMIPCRRESGSAGEGLPIAILGIAFDHLTAADAISKIEKMIASRQPHYVVTPNVDFLVQARRDIELRRILDHADLVLCDGTPLLWVSRLLGNALPERVAGADLVPLLISRAAEKGYRLFLLGASVESCDLAAQQLRARYPQLNVTGHYSPPFAPLLEMDHEEIRRRILAARPDVLLVSFGCPKQEKWIAMQYRSLGVPVTIGVGGTIDFLAGQLKRAPIWMRRSGMEWLFRLAQEPRRLFRRYATDLAVFAWTILPQWWLLKGHASVRDRSAQPPPRSRASLNTNRRSNRPDQTNASRLARTGGYLHISLGTRIELASLTSAGELLDQIMADGRHCLLDAAVIDGIDSSGVGFLLRLQKNLRAAGRYLVLVSPSMRLCRALSLMRVCELFPTAPDIVKAEKLLQELLQDRPVSICGGAGDVDTLRWHGEITAANADDVWAHTQAHLAGLSARAPCDIDLSDVRFIDSCGLGLMLRAQKLAASGDRALRFTHPQPAVRNVLKLARLSALESSVAVENGAAKTALGC